MREVRKDNLIHQQMWIGRVVAIKIEEEKYVENALLGPWCTIWDKFFAGQQTDVMTSVMAAKDV